MNNKTENKRTSHETFTPGKLVSELRQKLCQSNTDRGCQGLPGPPGPPGQRGESGERGRRGSKGKTGNKGDNGIMGPPGRSGKQGIMGPTGSKGETGLKGEKGDAGTAGLKGAKGEPGKSIAAPTVTVSPAKMTVNERRTAFFQCSVSGNPKPSSTWSKLEGKSEKILSATTDGRLILPNAAGSDSGVYMCSASNTLGRAQALVRLVVNGEFLSAVTKSWTGTWDVGRGAWGRGDVGTRRRGDAQTWGLGDVVREDFGTRGRAGIRGRDKQITPDSCAELVKYFF